MNPVWYLDMTPSHDWLTGPTRKLVDAAIESEIRTGEPFDMQPIARLTPFVDWMGVWEIRKREFWWERGVAAWGLRITPPLYRAVPRRGHAGGQGRS